MYIYVYVLTPISHMFVAASVCKHYSQWHTVWSMLLISFWRKEEKITADCHTIKKPGITMPFWGCRLSPLSFVTQACQTGNHMTTEDNNQHLLWHTWLWHLWSLAWEGNNWHFESSSCQGLVASVFVQCHCSIALAMRTTLAHLGNLVLINALKHSLYSASTSSFANDIMEECTALLLSLSFHRYFVKY